jgi:hypothetical protein
VTAWQLLVQTLETHERYMHSLLAVDLGLKTGLALFGQDAGIPHLAWLVLEGGGPLADVWEREASRHGIPMQQISAEAWRQQFLYLREQRSGIQAKEHAEALARRVITWSQARRPTSLRADAAEAILIGLWGVLAVGWLPHLPDELRR